MKERIYEVRKRSGLTQEKFAERLGFTRNYIGFIERGDRIPSDRTISDICREFGVNEEWLRTGKGEMYGPKSRDRLLSEFFADVLDAKDDDPIREYCTVLASLDPEQLHQLAEISRAMMEHWKTLQESNEKKEKADP